MKPIERIIVVCCARDFWLTRICVASIRYWYPEIPIGLLKDVSLGDFKTSELEKYWNVSIAGAPDPPRADFTKVEPFYLPGHQRILVLDSDIIFLGRLLETLEKHNEDFVVNWRRTERLSAEEKKKCASDGYYDVENLRKYLPDFEPPDFFFNTGQLVLTSSILQRNDFESWLVGAPPWQSVNCPEALFKFDQGLLNLLLTRMGRAGQCTIGICDFVKWSRHRDMVWPFELDKLKSREGYPFLIHWAEHKPFHKTGFVRGDLLGFFEDYYYSRVPAGSWKRTYRLIRRAQTSIPERTRRVAALMRKRIDLRKLILQESHPTKEPNTTAFLS